MPALAPVRSELLDGDTRALFLGWLAAIRWGGVKNNHIAPPPPSGLGQLTASLKALAKYLWIDSDLLEAAASYSPAKTETSPGAEKFADWLVSLDPGEKDAILRRIAEGEANVLRAELQGQFRLAWRANQTCEPIPAVPGCPATAGEWRNRWEKTAAERKRREERAQAHRRAREERLAAQAREARLRKLAKDPDAAWKRAESLVQERKPQSYDDAVRLLADLVELGKRSADPEAAHHVFQALRDRHSGKPSFIRRLHNAGL